MSDLDKYFTAGEIDRLEEIAANLDALAQQAEPLKRERKVILSRARQRKFNQS